MGKAHEWIDLPKETAMSYEEIRSEVTRYATKKRRAVRKPVAAAGMELDELTVRAKDLLSCSHEANATDTGERNQVITSLASMLNELQKGRVGGKGCYNCG